MTMRKLYLGRDKMIAGVCTGLADYLGVDETPVRAVFVVLALAGGTGILLYILAMLTLPERPDRIDHI